MTVAQSLKAYRVMAQRAFTPIDSKILAWVPHLPARPGGTFSGDSLAEAIKDIVQEYNEDREAPFADRTSCKTYVRLPTANNEPTILMNYQRCTRRDES